jgi:hypothetical protein
MISTDGDQGFPGKMVATITSVWTDDCRLTNLMTRLGWEYRASLRVNGAVSSG